MKKKTESNLKSWVYLIWNIVFSAIIITFSTLMLISVSDFTQEYDDIKQNWSLHAIQDIKIIQREQSCEKGFSEDFFNYKWQGTQEGCNCNGNIVLGKCKCKNGKKIEKFPPVDFDFWKLDNIPVKFCVKRSQNNFQKNAKTEANCKSTEKLCGTYEDSQFCVPQSEKCPITAFQISNEQGIDFQHSEVENNVLGTTYSLYLQREEGDEYPLVQLTASSGAGVCEKNYQNNIEKNGSYYPLYTPKNCDNELDNRWVKIHSSITQDEFFEINFLYKKVGDKLPNFEKYYDNPPKQPTFTLYSRSYNSVNISCRKYLVDFYTNQKDVPFIQNELIESLIACCIFGAYIIIIETPFLFKRRLLTFKGKTGVFIIKICIYAVAFISVIVTYTHYNPFYIFAKKIDEHGCLDPINEKFFQQTTDDIHDSYIWIIIGSFIFYFITEHYLIEILLSKVFKGRCLCLQNFYFSYKNNDGNDNEDDESNENNSTQGEKESNKEIIFQLQENPNFIETAQKSYVSVTEKPQQNFTNQDLNLSTDSKNLQIHLINPREEHISDVSDKNKKLNDEL